MISVQELKDYLVISNNDEDMIIQSIIDSETKRINEFCNTDFSFKRYEITFIGNGKPFVILSKRISNIIEITIDGQQVNLSDIYFNRLGITNIKGKPFNSGSIVKIKADLGFEVIPNDIKQALIELVALRFKERDRVGQNTKNLGSEQLSFITTEMTDSIKNKLKNYAIVHMEQGIFYKEIV